MVKRSSRTAVRTCQKCIFFLTAKFSKHQKCLPDQKGTYKIQNVTAKSWIVLENTNMTHNIKEENCSWRNRCFSRHISTFIMFSLFFLSEQDNTFFIYTETTFCKRSRTFLISFLYLNLNTFSNRKVQFHICNTKLFQSCHPIPNFTCFDFVVEKEKRNTRID